MTDAPTEEQNDEALRSELVQERMRLENTKTLLHDTQVSIETLTQEISVIAGNIEGIERILRIRAGSVEEPPRLVGCND